MVVKGMKVGDTFKDGVSNYVVEKVLPDGTYISKRITGLVEEKVTEEKPVTRRTRTKKNAE